MNSRFSYDRRVMLAFVSIIALVVIGCAVGHFSGTTETSWSEPDRRVIDRVSNWSGDVLYRNVTTLADDGEPLIYAQGPMQEGQPHGEWHISSARYDSTDTQYFWKGERVSRLEFFSLEK